MTDIKQAPFTHAYKSLGVQFSTAQRPTPVDKPEIIRINTDLARFLNLNPEQLATHGTEIFAGNQIPAHSQPIAAVYAGHQFGHWNPQLGDGRAILLGELSAQNGAIYDVQLKGGGTTPYSRRGDGRSPLGPVLREYIVSEAMNALGISTTRALAAVTTGEQVIRDSRLPGAILTRVASSHIRVGTFQYFAARRDTDSIKTLADHVIARHYQRFIEQRFEHDPYTGLLNAAISAQAHLIAQWMSVGFIHGVMNTDNMLVNGETVDYGPCAFMDAFNPDQVYSSIDHQGRYAYRNQPDIAVWNLSWLANTLLPLMAEQEALAIEKAEHALQQFAPIYQQHYQQIFANKLGFDKATESTQELTQSFLTLLAEHRLDFTLSFRNLKSMLLGQKANTEAKYNEHFDDWLNRWQGTLTTEGISTQQAAITLDKSNPLFIPRNHQIEAAIDAATDHSDFKLFHELVDTLTQPFTDQPERAYLALPPEKGQGVFRTFCGT